MSDEEKHEELAGQPVISFATVPGCEAWFAAHYADHRGFWLKIGKMGAAETVNYAEALDVALCHGWIDGQKRGYDKTYWLQRFTPRGPVRRALPSPTTWRPHSRPTRRPRRS